MSESTTMTVSLQPIDNLDTLERGWRALQQRSRHSFFTSWSWIGCWLKCLPDHARPQVLKAESNGVIVGLALFGQRRLRRRKVLISEGLFLNETGDDQLDELTTEHNGILTDTACEIEVHRACLDFLLQQRPDWDELYFGGIDSDDRLNDLLTDPPLSIEHRLLKEVACPTVNLQAIRDTDGDYFAHLSSNARQKMRRSIRAVEKELGPLTLDSPASMTEAEQFFDELKRLHQAHWESKGHPGAFGHEFCDRFHRTLLAERWPHGEIQLLRVRAGGSVLGYLHNFVYAGRVLFYQAGFDYQLDSKHSPGIISQVLAIQHNLAQGAAVYDFLGGDCQYKRSLATDSTKMRWIVWQRPRWKLKIENWLRTARRKYVSAIRSA